MRLQWKCDDKKTEQAELLSELRSEGRVQLDYLGTTPSKDNAPSGSNSGVMVRARLAKVKIAETLP